MSNDKVKNIALEVGLSAAKDEAMARQSLAETMRRLRSLEMTDADFVHAGVRLIETQGLMTEDGKIIRGVPGGAPDPYQSQHHAPKSAGMRHVMTGEWEARLVVKESNGKSREVWQVRGQGSNKYDFDFRHEIVAIQVAAVLNETGSKFDGRILRIKQLCEQETAILIEMRKTKSLFESGNKKAAADLKGLKAELDNVRRVLGVKS